MGLEISLGGFAVGLLIGFTGMGGGFLMTPMLILLFGVHPSVAVGTDLVYASITKFVGAWQHWRQGTVDLRVVKVLATGSVPGAVAGAAGVQIFHGWFGPGFEGIMSRVLGVAFLVVSAVLLLRAAVPGPGGGSGEMSRPAAWKLVTLGVVGGGIVGLTSVGSGSLFIALLTFLYPVSASRLVGTDIAHAFIVSAVAGLVHFAAGTVDLPLVGWLLVGSLPGIVLGSRLSKRIPDRIVRLGLTVMLAVSGLKLL
ncbi:MAG: sulfite exporter TauE/SafE family protein [Kyrpidia tusciae]|nr:sulfite exporter TauE/SafE family protein [Kyrpidia tusciae]MBE3552730.1 sulfite exporter TauE/SafE family protein [Kyrpidia tusciae]